MAALAMIVPGISFKVETSGLAWEPYSHVSQPAVGHDRKVQRIGGYAARWYVAARGIQDGKIALLAASQERRSQTLGIAGVARIGHTARRQRVEGERGTRGRCEVAVDVDDHIGRVAGVYQPP